MQRIKRILVTGHRGYIGSVMAPLLASRGHEVVGLDVDYFGECTLVPGRDDIPHIAKDVRDTTVDDLRGFDAVVHLAALSNDPIGNLNAEWTREINLEGSVRLAAVAREAGVRRFLFSSSCIMYGLSEGPVVDETSALDPRTEYARSKVEAEREIAALATDAFAPTFLRNGTVYGLSPRMRFDTVLNDLMGAAVAEGAIVVRGDGTPWRPVVHVDDVARAFAAVLETESAPAHNQAFNVGADAVNISIGDLAKTVADVVPGCRLETIGSPAADRRSYRASFAKFARSFPDVRFRTPAQGAQDLYNAFASVPLTSRLYRDGRFIRLEWLHKLLADGSLMADSLRWTTSVGA
jgi:nucleoside-diphosphate-sugar epimerase